MPSGPTVDEDEQESHGPESAAIDAASAAAAVNDATRVALFKATWLNRAMLLAVATILLLSLGQLAGAADDDRKAPTDEEADRLGQQGVHEPNAPQLR